MAVRTETKRIVVHCLATKPSQDVGAAWVDELHKGFGWSGIGYQRVITRSGKLELGREIHEIGAHTKGHNRDSIGIALAGGLNEETGEPENNFTAAQLRTLRQQIDALRIVYPTIEDVCGHRDLSPDVDGDGIIERHEWLKDCPCFDVRSWYFG